MRVVLSQFILCCCAWQKVKFVSYITANYRHGSNASHLTPLLVNSGDWLSRNFESIGSLHVPTVLLSLAVRGKLIPHVCGLNFGITECWIEKALENHQLLTWDTKLQRKSACFCYPTAIVLFHYPSSVLFCSWMSRRCTFDSHRTEMCCHFFVFHSLCPWECGWPVRHLMTTTMDQQCNCCCEVVNGL